MNTLYPGKPDYTGPTSGYFTLLHHEGPLIEWSDNVMERIMYINNYKPASEREIRKAHIIYLDPSIIDGSNYEAKCATLYAHYEAKRTTLYADYEAKRATLYAAIVDYIKPLITDFRWDGNQLVF